MFADKSVVPPWGVRQECRIELCPEVQRINDEANRLRALLARVLDHLPADHPLAVESRAALD